MDWDFDYVRNSFKCFPPIKHAFSHNVWLMKSYLDPFWQARAFVVSNLITFLIIIYNITKDSQQWMDVFLAYMQYRSTVYAAANSTSIIVSLFLMCRNFFFLIWLIIYVHCTNPTIVTQDTRLSYCSAITIFLVFDNVFFR